MKYYSLNHHFVIDAMKNFTPEISMSQFQSLLSVTRLAQSVSLSVERSGGRSLPSSVSWETVELQSSEKMGGVNLQPALEELDYVSSSGTLDFSNEFTVSPVLRFFEKRPKHPRMKFSVIPN